jgi:glutathione-regulated potassium-efflux system ancillary protein KefC/glutathione-regulated potassium-efflux system protein KefB
MLALVPMLAGEAASDGEAASGWLDFARAAVVLVVYVIGGRYLLRPLLRLVAAVDIHEIFTAAALLLVMGSALLMESLGFSMGLGAFLAGVLVADSEYRHQLESDIEPFKGLLLGLFFIAVGMSTDLGLLAAQPGRIVALTLGLMALKAGVLCALAQAFGVRGRHAVALGLLLSQGGEFGFVLFTLAVGEGVLPEALAGTLTLVVTLSMVLTPIVYLVYERVVARMRSEDERPYDQIDNDDHEVVICGFGRFGQIVARILNMRDIPFTALEINPNQVDFVKRFGNKIYYGDASRLEILRAARVDKARVLVVAVDDVAAAVRIAETVRRHFPRVALYARARDRRHALKLMGTGVKVVVRDTLHSSLRLSTHVLQGLGLESGEALAAAELFEHHDAALLERQFAIQDDEEALIQSSKASARELRDLFESDAGRK